MKIAFVTYGDKSAARALELVTKHNWFNINSYAEQRGKQIDKTVWSVILDTKFDIDVLVIISDSYVPFDTLRWAEFCSLHGITFRFNVGTIKMNLDPYADYGVAQPKSKRISHDGKPVERLAIQIDPVILGLMRASWQWKQLKEYCNADAKERRVARELNAKRQADYQVSRLLYEFNTTDWKAIRRHAMLYCLPTLVLEVYNASDSSRQNEILTQNLVPDFCGYAEFYRACWTTERNEFMTEVLDNMHEVPMGFSTVPEMEGFLHFWKPVYDITPSLTDIEAASSISYFLLLGIAPELRDIHLQLIPKMLPQLNGNRAGVTRRTSRTYS